MSSLKFDRNYSSSSNSSSSTGGDITEKKLIWVEARFLFHFERELYALMGRFLEKLKNLSLDFLTGISEVLSPPAVVVVPSPSTYSNYHFDQITCSNDSPVL